MKKVVLGILAALALFAAVTPTLNAVSPKPALVADDPKPGGGSGG